MRTVKFDVYGLNQLKVLNSFVAENIAVYRLIKSPKKMSFRVAADRCKRVAEILDAQGLKYDLTQIRAKDVLKKMLTRTGLAVGVTAMLVLGIIASKFLWKIEISGNERVDDLTIVRLLKENGISVGSKVRYDCKTVERVLMEMPDIAAVSAQLVGTTLKVDVIESTERTPEEPYGDIVSLYDAMVTRIIVTSGSAKVKIGDKVAVGNMLIEGVEYDTEGNPLLSVRAEGQVFGKVNFTFSEIFPATETRRTGKFVKQTDIILFNKRIGRDVEVDFLYEAKKSSTRIGSFLPLYAQTTVYYELENYELSLDELIKKAEDKAIDTLVIKAGMSTVEVTSNYKLVAKGLYRINVHIEAEVSIGGKTG